MGIPGLRAALKVRVKETPKQLEFRAWCKAHRLPPGLTVEFRFDPVRRWRMDFAWPDRLVAVEVHGAVFRGGRHVRGNGFLNDREKMNTALCRGWRVLEVGTPGKHPATLYSPAMLAWCKAVL